MLTASAIPVSGFELYTVYSEYNVYFWLLFIVMSDWLAEIHLHVCDPETEKDTFKLQTNIEPSANTPHLWGSVPRKPLLSH